MSRINTFIEKLFDASEEFRRKTSLPSSTRYATHHIKGEILGEFYSIIIIDRKLTTPELIVRDFTICKQTVINIWDEEL
jgi:hypothetical protein